MTSRIFVKNIPPNSSESNIKSHFSTKGTITDVRVIPHRRIAYIGYKTPQEASSAVKYFNRSYVQTSKIEVQIAKPIVAKGEQPSVRNVDPRSASPTKKRKRDESEHPMPKAGKKFEEFLKTMTATSTKNTWSNNDDMQFDESAIAVSEPESQPLLNPPESPRPLSIEKDAPMPVSPVGSDDQSMLSEDDWLRSKTSRLLDVADDIDSRLAASSLDAGRRKTSSKASAVELAERESIDPITSTPLPTEGIIFQTGRLFVRNLPYSATEKELMTKFAPFGAVSEVHLAQDSKTDTSKGYAYILYEDPAHAVAALGALDGTDFQGRLMHVLPAAPKRENKLDEFAIAKLPLKQQRAIRKKAEASTTQFNWNSMYMNADAVISSVASRLGVSKSELLDPTSSDAAVRQAHAETAVINETKAFLQHNGVDLEAFNGQEKDDRVMLIKNFPFSTSADEIRKMLTEHGELKRLLFPPAGTLAIAEFHSPSSGRTAFSALAYRRFKGSVLFLEKGPKNLFTGETTTNASITASSAGTAPPVSEKSFKEISTTESGQENSTLYIRNLNFSTTTDRLESFLSSLDGYLWCRVKTKTDAKHPGKVLSMGFGFAEFSSTQHAKAAMEVMNGRSIDNHAISISMAKRNDTVETGKKTSANHIEMQKKIVIKNLPFEATKKDIRALLSKYGSLHSVRMPKKLGNKTRGFAFAEFVTAREAENAMLALKDTHLLGRRLVIDFAKSGAETAEEEIYKMSQKVAKQTEAVALQGLRMKSKTAVKLNTEGAVEGEDDE